MTEQEVQRGIRLVRYGGVVVTVTVFVVLVAFAVVVGNAIGAGGAGGEALNNMLAYIVGFTVFAAVLSAVVYFAYRAYLLNKLKAAKP